MPSTTDEQPPEGGSRPSRRSLAPLLAVAAVLAVLAAAGTVRAWRTDAPGSPAAPGPRSSSTSTTEPEPDPDPGPGVQAPGVPVVVGLDLFVGGERVPGRWYAARGRGTHWVALREDRTWWWGHDTEPQRIDGVIDQPPGVSPGGGYLAQVLTESSGGWTLSGAPTERGGVGFGTVDLPGGPRAGPAPRAIAVTDDGLVVVGGPRFQWLWRPLVDGATVDLAESAPGQAVIGSTEAGLVVNAGEYDRTDGQQGAPYLAQIAEDGTLSRLDPVPIHDVLEASDAWLAWVPPGTVGGEASGTPELQVQRRDGTAQGVVGAPEGWLFVAPGFRWESADRLLALVVTRDGQDEGLARCRPDLRTCELVDPAG